MCLFLTWPKESGGIGAAEENLEKPGKRETQDEVFWLHAKWIIPLDGSVRRIVLQGLGQFANPEELYRWTRTAIGTMPMTTPSLVTRACISYDTISDV